MQRVIQDSSLNQGGKIASQDITRKIGEICISFSGDSVVKNPLPVQEMRVRSLGREDPLKKEVATHSSILAWKITWTEELGRLQSMGHKESNTT